MSQIPESIPRFRILLQDGDTGIQMAAGADDLAEFTKTDLMKFVRKFRTNVTLAERPPVITDDSPEEDKMLLEP